MTDTDLDIRFLFYLYFSSPFLRILIIFVPSVSLLNFSWHRFGNFLTYTSDTTIAHVTVDSFRSKFVAVFYLALLLNSQKILHFRFLFYFYFPWPFSRISIIFALFFLSFFAVLLVVPACIRKGRFLLIGVVAHAKAKGFCVGVSACCRTLIRSFHPHPSHTHPSP